MTEGADGQYYLQAGAVLLAGTKIFFSFYLIACSPSHVHFNASFDVNAGWWRLEDKIDLPLDAIHTTGNIPHCTLPPPPSLLLPPYHPHARTHARSSSSSHLYLTQLTHALADEEKF